MPLSTQESDPKPYQPKYNIVDIEKCEKMFFEMLQVLYKMKENIIKMDNSR